MGWSDGWMGLRVSDERGCERGLDDRLRDEEETKSQHSAVRPSLCISTTWTCLGVVVVVCGNLWKLGCLGTISQGARRVRVCQPGLVHALFVRVDGGRWPFGLSWLELA